MKSMSLLNVKAVRSALAVAAAMACVGASAQTFTFTPSSVTPPLNGTAFTADNLLTSDFAKVTLTSTGFTEYGYLPISGAQLGGSFVSTTGLGSTYGLVVAYTGAGTNTFTSGNTTIGSYTSLTYNLIGYNGNFDFTGAPATGPAGTILGSGSLIPGTSSYTIVNSATPSFATSLNVSFNRLGGFTSPTPFYNSAFVQFGHKGSDFSQSGNVITLKQGSGSTNFVTTPVPEPETYALMLGGLAAIGFVARRRNNG